MERSTGRLKALKIRVDALTEARLGVRAQQAGSTLSEYVRRLIARDLSRADEAGADGAAAPPPIPSPVPDPLTPQLLELALVTGILVRAQLARTVGEDEARRLESRAQEKAAEHMKVLLAVDDGEADSDLEPQPESIS